MSKHYSDNFMTPKHIMNFMREKRYSGCISRDTVSRWVLTRHLHIYVRTGQLYSSKYNVDGEVFVIANIRLDDSCVERTGKFKNFITKFEELCFAEGSTIVFENVLNSNLQGWLAKYGYTEWVGNNNLDFVKVPPLKSHCAREMFTL